jgi:hypothetical protein
MTGHELVQKELVRLRDGHTHDAAPEALGLVSFVVGASHDMSTIIHRAMDVLLTVDDRADNWPSPEKWPRILPEWFVAKCAPEKSNAEASAWLARWQALSPEKQKEEEGRQPWSLLDWLYWLEPERREWFWWTATVKNPQEGVIELVVKAWPFPWGSFAWLMQASGAEVVRAEGVK